MVAACGADIRKLGLYDAASNAAWGMEDVNLFAAAKAADSNLAVLRLTEINLVHIWHPKSCAVLAKAGNKKRYRMCMGTKGVTDGNPAMLALELEALESVCRPEAPAPPWVPQLAGSPGAEWRAPGVVEWAYVTADGYYDGNSGDSVWTTWDASQRVLIDDIFTNAVTHGADSSAITCDWGTPRVASAWQALGRWGVNDVLLLLTCRGAQAWRKLALVHAPVRGGMVVKPFASASVPISTLAVLIPFACVVDELRVFLVSLVRELRKVPGQRRVVITWADCDGHSIGSRKLLNDVHTPTLDDLQLAIQDSNCSAIAACEVVELKTSFSRSAALNAAWSRLSPDEIGVVLDIDMRVTAQYFSHARAFAQTGAVYFPITFSRYNPAVVTNFARFLKRSKEHEHGRILTGLEKHSVFNEMGTWRRFGFGMVAATAGDLARRNASYDEANKAWGLEDVVVYDQLVKAESEIVMWRAYDPSIQHIYHPKNCSLLVGTSREYMCFGSMVSTEGSRMELGVELLRVLGELPEGDN